LSAGPLRFIRVWLPGVPASMAIHAIGFLVLVALLRPEPSPTVLEIVLLEPVGVASERIKKLGPPREQRPVRTIEGTPAPRGGGVSRELSRTGEQASEEPEYLPRLQPALSEASRRSETPQSPAEARPTPVHEEVIAPVPGNSPTLASAKEESVISEHSSLQPSRVGTHPEGSGGASVVDASVRSRETKRDLPASGGAADEQESYRSEWSKGKAVAHPQPRVEAHR